MTSVEAELREAQELVRSRIAAACERSDRAPAEIALVGVSKRQPIVRIQSYLDTWNEDWGTPLLGENYVQEFQEKRESLAAHSFGAHLIGPLQSNKAKLAVSLFDVIETVGSHKLAQKLNQEAEKIGKIQEVFVQVNISEDESKHGFAPGGVEHFLSTAEYSSLRISGLMTITRFYDDPNDARGDFSRLRSLRDSIDAKLGLSMGMSADFEVAIEEGATVVRVGTALFGARV